MPTKPTNPDKGSQAPRPLTVQQLNAIDLLLLGKSDGEVAQTLGLHRETIWQWRHNRVLFVAELNRRRCELFVGAQRRLLSLVHRAIDTLEAAIAEGSIKDAWELLRATGIYGATLIQEPTNPEDLLDHWVESALLRERIPKSTDELHLAGLIGDRQNPRYEQRKDELRREFLGENGAE
jgi:DNA-binding CsgD family transcriptional regulator